MSLWWRLTGKQNTIVKMFEGVCLKTTTYIPCPILATESEAGNNFLSQVKSQEGQGGGRKDWQSCSWVCKSLKG